MALAVALRVLDGKDARSVRHDLAAVADLATALRVERRLREDDSPACPASAARGAQPVGDDRHRLDASQ
jgi:hypothetical protein